jgi:hypothetical protein
MLHAEMLHADILLEHLLLSPRTSPSFEDDVVRRHGDMMGSQTSVQVCTVDSLDSPNQGHFKPTEKCIHFALRQREEG